MSEEINKVKCPKCEGSGSLVYNGDKFIPFNEVIHKYVSFRNVHERYTTLCHQCGGTGEIEWIDDLFIL